MLNIIITKQVYKQYMVVPVMTDSLLWQGIGELFEKIKQENKANGYPNGDGLFFTNLYITPVLRNISLHLEKGEMLAVAGSTGSGKVVIFFKFNILSKTLDLLYRDRNTTPILLDFYC